MVEHYWVGILWIYVIDNKLHNFKDGYYFNNFDSRLREEIFNDQSTTTQVCIFETSDKKVTCRLIFSFRMTH